MALTTKSLIQSSTVLSGQLLRKQLSPLLFLLILGSLLTIQGEDTIQILSQDQERARWMIQLGMGTWDLFEGILLFLVLSWGVAKVRDFRSPNFKRLPFRNGYLGSFLAEYFRVLAQILFYFLLLIIPALIRYCRLIFVPYIALFSKRYREDKVDAVELSVEFSKKYFWTILALFVVTTGVQIAIEFLPNLVPVLHSHLLRFVFMTLSFGISIWSYSFVFILFEQALEEKTWT